MDGSDRRRGGRTDGQGTIAAAQRNHTHARYKVLLCLLLCCFHQLTASPHWPATITQPGHCAIRSAALWASPPVCSSPGRCAALGVRLLLPLRSAADKSIPAPTARASSSSLRHAAGGGDGGPSRGGATATDAPAMRRNRSRYGSRTRTPPSCNHIYKTITAAAATTT